MEGELGSEHALHTATGATVRDSIRQRTVPCSTMAPWVPPVHCSEPCAPIQMCARHYVLPAQPR